MIAVVQRLAGVKPQWLQHLFADAGERLPISRFGLGLLAKHGKNLGLAVGFGRRELLFYVLIAEFKDTKPPFPPPFNLLWQLLVELPAELRQKDEVVDTSGFKVVPDLKTLTKLEVSEGVHLKRCLHVQHEREQQSQDWQLEQIRDVLSHMQDASRNQFETLTRQLEASTGASS